MSTSLRYWVYEVELPSILSIYRMFEGVYMGLAGGLNE
jgi:hypothetical protein